MGSRIALLIGNGRFSDPDLEPLKGPINDVRKLEEVLSDSRVGQFNDVHVLVDQTDQVLREVINERLDDARPDDLVLIYYSGHGKLDSRGQLYLATSNTRVKLLKATALSVRSIKDFIDDSPAHQAVLILDCCYSGAIEGALRGSVEDALKHQPVAGLHILVSSTSLQTSSERENEDGGEVLGAFTRIAVEGIASGAADDNGDGKITVQELRDFVQRQIKGQSPQYWAMNARGNPVLAVSPVGIRKQLIRLQLERLDDWHGTQVLPDEIYLDARRLILNSQASEQVNQLHELLRELTSEPPPSAATFVQQWRAAARPKPDIAEIEDGGTRDESVWAARNRGRRASDARLRQQLTDSEKRNRREGD